MFKLGLGHLLFLLSCLISVSVVYSGTETLPGCQSKCGNIDIPYPFGIGENCSFAIWTKVNCNTSFKPPKPFLTRGRTEIVQLSETEIRVKSQIGIYCQDDDTFYSRSSLDFLEETPYTYSSTKNKLYVIGCGTLRVDGNFPSVECTSYCGGSDKVINGSCSGSGCCQTSIPNRFKFDGVGIYFSPGDCLYTFQAEEDTYKFKVSDLTNATALANNQLVVNFAVGNQTCKQARKNIATYACKENSYCFDSVDGSGYLCSCNKGYEGNPYLNNSCRDINECEDPRNNPCEGTCTNTKGSYHCSKISEVPLLQLTLGLGLGSLFLLVFTCRRLWITLAQKEQKTLETKKKFFQQNGGLLLKELLSAHKSDTESTKIFTLDELKLATKNYDKSRIIGQGGSGTVYKGVLPDLKIVAIKKSKIMDESQIGQFINEVNILSQINHRNVVRLLGCCLETQVPILVYEFVPNGTLSYHLHKGSGALSFLSWKDRLRIAAETSSALAYLHSAASTPIIHRDVKSDNILLDNNYTSKVSDFGISKLNLLDETKMSTLVQGTIGYLDPDYFFSGQLTEKSDVYSFGVVLVELLTGERPLCFDRLEEQRTLATYFMSFMKEQELFQLLGGRIVLEKREKEQVRAAAELAKRCLCVKGEDRPLMIELAAELEALRGISKDQFVESDNDDASSLATKDADLYVISLSTVYSSDDSSGKHSLDTETIRAMDVPR